MCIPYQISILAFWPSDDDNVIVATQASPRFVTLDIPVSQSDTYIVYIHTYILVHTYIHCAHRASILLRKIDARLGGRLAVIGRDAIEKKYIYIFLDLAKAQRGLFRLFSQQGAQNGPRPPCYAYRRSRGGCRPSATAEGWLPRASVRPPD